MTVAYAVIAVILLSVLFISIAVLIRDSGDRRLQERLSQISAVVIDDKSSRDLQAIVIRRSQMQSGVLTGVATRFLKFAPDSPDANIIPVKVVALLGVVTGLAGIWVMMNLLDPLQGILAGIAIGFLAVRFIFGWEHRRYTQALLKQLPDMIELMISGSRAGLPVSESLRNVAREMQPPTKQAIAEVVSDIGIGRTVDEALLKVYERTRISEYAIIAVAIGVQTQTGGALAESLQNVAEIVRTRLTIAARASALASEAKASAVILVALPFVAGGALAIVRPGYLDLLFEDPRGVSIIAYGVASMVAGIMTMRWMIQNAVAD
jgi:tight adherence protein B